MTRRLLSFLTALSTLMCVAVVVLWDRSGRVLDAVHWARDDSAGLDTDNGWWTRRRRAIHAGRGIVALEWVTQSQRTAAPLGGINRPGDSYFHAAERLTDRWPERSGAHAVDERHGFAFAAGEPYPYGRRGVLCFPMWLAAFATAAFPSARLDRHLRPRRRASKQRCQACDYDLRATPTQCPECGTPSRAYRNGSSG